MYFQFFYTEILFNIFIIILKYYNITIFKINFKYCKFSFLLLIGNLFSSKILFDIIFIISLDSFKWFIIKF